MNRLLNIVVVTLPFSDLAGEAILGNYTDLLLGCDCDFKLDEAEDLSKGHLFDARDTAAPVR